MVDNELATARRNMVLADGDDMGGNRNRGRERRRNVDRLDAALQTAQRWPGRTEDEPDQRIDHAIKTLGRPREATLRHPSRTARTAGPAIEKVEVWSTQRVGDPRGSSPWNAAWSTCDRLVVDRCRRR